MVKMLCLTSGSSKTARSQNRYPSRFQHAGSMADSSYWELKVLFAAQAAYRQRKKRVANTYGKNALPYLRILKNSPVTKSVSKPFSACRQHGRLFLSGRFYFYIATLVAFVSGRVKRKHHFLNTSFRMAERRAARAKT